MAIEWCSGQNAVYHPVAQINNLPDATIVVNTVNTVCGLSHWHKKPKALGLIAGITL